MMDTLTSLPKASAILAGPAFGLPAFGESSVIGSCG